MRANNRLQSKIILYIYRRKYQQLKIVKNRLYNSNNRTVINEFGVVRQVTNYYPFGGVFSTTAYNSGDDLQPYKYNGKELDRTHGLDWYDYGARNYDGIVPGFTSIDRFCEKYYHMSPYTYCGNNPMNRIDVNGDSVVVLLAPAGGQGFGHMAILVQDENYKWHLYSKNGTEEHGHFFGKEGPEGSPYHNDRGEKSFDSISDFFNDKKANPLGTNLDDMKQPEYTEGYLIPTSISEDQKIIDGALEEINKDYFALGSNCAWTVQNALNNAGKNGGSGILNKRPKDVIYPKIIKNNPGGTVKLFYNTANRTYYKNK